PPSPILYFEVTITSMSPQTTVAIGLATVPYPCFRLPGWHDWSIGYHSDDGRVFVSDDNVGVPYGKPYRLDDTVGCGVDTRTGKVFYTRNGERMPIVDCSDVPAPRLTVNPCIGADGECSLKTNFGTEPFRWQEANDSRAMYA
ncbi:concanavalin A-like lectin/glucanase domain-containing protein, partial [Catenaria anguillulae PL171]